MEGDSTSLRRLFAKTEVDERNGDFPTIIRLTLNQPLLHSLTCRAITHSVFMR
jgi:hypothetical protein